MYFCYNYYINKGKYKEVMNKNFLAGALMGICLIFAGMILIYNQQKGYSIDIPQPTNQKQPQPLPSFNKDLLLQNINLITNDYPALETGISVQSYLDNLQININADSNFDAASTNKLPVAVYALHKIDHGELSFDTNIYGLSLKETLELMIIQSDNQAWENLLSYFGIQTIKEYLAPLGVTSFYNNDQNIISPQDSAKLLRLSQNGVLGKDTAEYLANIMAQSVTGPVTLATEFANSPKKTGWLDTNYNFVGIIGKDNKKYSIAIFTKNIDGSELDYQAAQDYINKVLLTINASLSAN